MPQWTGKAETGGEPPLVPPLRHAYTTIRWRWCQGRCCLVVWIPGPQAVERRAGTFLRCRQSCPAPAGATVNKGSSA
jgi:hypothetical protein